MTNPWIIPDRINLLGNPIPVDSSLKAKTRAFFARPAVKDTAIGAAFVATAALLAAVSDGMSAFGASWFAFHSLVGFCAFTGLFVTTQAREEKEAVYSLRGRKQDLQDIRLNTNPAKTAQPSDDIKDGCCALTNKNKTKWALFGPATAYVIYLHFTLMNPAATLAAGAFVYPFISRYLRQKECWKKVASGEYAVEGYDPYPWGKESDAPEKPARFSRLKGWLWHNKAA